MTRPKILTITTDFGHQGGYVASMKGVILSLAPDAQLVDVSHQIAPQNILEGAFLLAGLIESFPHGTVHLAVIDPGVGTERQLVAARVADQWFVAPDNGLLAGVLQGRSPQEIREITSPAIRQPVVSSTFHGRDILAPAAAHLLLGGSPEDLGPIRDRWVSLANFQPRVDDSGVIGEVIFRDTFGNLITNVRRSHLSGRPADSWSVEIAGERIGGLRRTYGDDPAGALIALAGSSGWMEIAVVNGDAGRSLGAGPGMTVWFKGR